MVNAGRAASSCMSMLVQDAKHRGRQHHGLCEVSLAHNAEQLMLPKSNVKLPVYDKALPLHTQVFKRYSPYNLISAAPDAHSKLTEIIDISTHPLICSLVCMRSQHTVHGHCHAPVHQCLHPILQNSTTARSLLHRHHQPCSGAISSRSASAMRRACSRRRASSSPVSHTRTAS